MVYGVMEGDERDGEDDTLSASRSARLAEGGCSTDGSPRGGDRPGGIAQLSAAARSAIPAIIGARRECGAKREGIRSLAQGALAPGMITLDTSGAIALLNRKDPDHAPARAALLEDPGPWLGPGGILAEVAYLVETNLCLEVLEAWLYDHVTPWFCRDAGGRTYQGLL